MTTNLLNNLSNVLKKGPSETQKNPLAFEAQSAAEKSNRVLITCLSRVNHLIQYRCMRYAALLFAVLVMSIGQAWGIDFTPAQIASGTTTSGISVSSSFSKSTGKKLCTSQTSEDAISLDQSAGATYNDKYLWITVPANCKITAVGVLTKSNGDSGVNGGVVYWSGAAATDGITSTATISAGARNTADCTTKVDLSVPANTRTVGIYRAPKIKNNAFNGSGTAVGGTSTFNVFALSVTATGTVTHNLTNVTKSSGNTTATLGSAYNASYKASDGYTLPSTITVTINGSAATAGTDYEWDSSTGDFTVPAAKVNGAIVITITGEAAAAGSGWGIASSDNSWTASADEMSGSGTVTKTLSLSANADLQFKIVDISGNTWYGNGEIWGGTKTQSVSSPGTANNCHLLTTEAGSYTFSFNTSTKDLTITYPNSYTFYYANTSSWSNVYVYKFTSNGSTGNNDAWPGTEIESPAYTCGGTDYYAATSDGYAKLIFTNNSGNQTGDMVVSSSNAGKYVAGTDNSWSNFPTYTVTYNKNGDGAGGAGSVTGSVPTDSNSPYACGSTVTVKGNTGSLARDGYNFIGWNTAPGGGGTSYAADATFTISANTTLYAQWEEEVTYTVTYSLNGGKYNGSSTAPTQAAVASGTEITLPSLTPTKEGYVFASWKCSVGNTYHWESYSYTMTAANTTFTAQWVAAASLVSGTLYYTADIVPLSLNDAISATNQYAKGISSNGVFTSLGNPLRTSNSDGTMEINKKDKQTVDGYNFYDHMWFKGGPEKSGVVPSSRAVKFTIPSAGTLSIYCTRGDRILLSNGTTAKTLTSNTSGNIIRRDTTITAGTYYLYANNSGTSLAGMKFVQSCTAPSALAAASPTAKGITLSVTDANDVNNYEFYVSTESTAPEAGATATHSVSSNKSLTITNLVAGTTYYAWARSVCGVSNKSGWTALTGTTFTTSTVSADYHLTNVTKSSGATSGIGGSTFTAVFAAVSGYSMPTPTVTIDGNTATSGTDYTWTAGTGTLTINANKINGDIDITLNSAPSAPSSAVISGTYHYFPGDNISLTCTPSGNNGPTTYQWYKGGKADGNAIDGATSATYTKNSCAFADAGSYYCKVTCNETSIWAVTNSHENYDVKILRLYVNGSKSGEPYGNVDFVKVNSTTATASIALGSNWTYGFNIADGCGHYYGNAGTMQYNNYGPWVTNLDGTDCGLTTTNAATYIFTINYSDLSSITTTVTFPVANQAAGKVIYFDNNVLKWTGSSIYYRIGHSSHSQADQLSLVSGTANLYKMTTREYNGFSGWHIANAIGDVGSGKSIYKTVDGTPITEATAHEGGAVTATAITVTPTTSRGNGADVGVNDNCEFYNYTITTGMKTQNVAISDYSNGTITVAYTDTEGASQSFTSGNRDLAHTVILTSITATPNTGYDASAITINGGAYSANYVVTGATTIAASFTPHVYSITYLDQGGSAFSGTHTDTPSAHPTSHTYNTATNLNGATKAGYTFEGWYTNSACTGDAVTSLGATDYTADITLYAKWTALPLVTWTMNLNTGDWGAASTSTSDGTNISSIGTSRTNGGTGSTSKATAKVKLASDEVTDSSEPSESANFTFSIANTKQVEITKLDCQVFNVGSSNDGQTTYKAQISDALGHVYNSTNTVCPENDATLTSVSFVFGSSKILRGAVTIRVYGWVSGSGDFTDFRMGPDIKFYGTVDDYVCSAPAAPTISGTNTYTADGDNISLTASCASGTDASTTYTWYKGENWATASAASPVQTAKTAAEGGTTFTKKAYDGDGGTYWCEASNGSGCEAHNSTGYAITVNCPAIGTPTTPTIEDLDATGATLGWDPAGRVSGALGYQVSIVVTSTSAEVVAWTSEGITNERTYTVSGLTTGVGYTFKVRGWSNGCVGSESSVDFTPTTPITYTVTYKYNGATSGASPASATGESVTLPTPTRTGYVLDGWYETDGTKAGIGGATYEPEADITLYARWEEECDAEGVAKSTTDVAATGYTTYIEKGGDKVVFTAAPTLGFKYKDAAGNTINNSTTAVVRNNAYKCQISSDSGNKGSIKTNNAFSNVDSISFYFAASDKGGCKIAVWCSTDDFSADSTSLLSATTYADNNSEFKLKTLAIPSGKKASALRFKFRFTVTSSGKTSYIDSLKVYSSTSGGGTCYHVYYHGNGAESGFVSDTTSYSDGAKATVLSYNDSRYPLTKDGYDFQGWATSAGGSAAYSDGQKITIDGADVHLYAKWATASSALVTWKMKTADNEAWATTTGTGTTDGTNISSIGTSHDEGDNKAKNSATAKTAMASGEVSSTAAPDKSARFTFTIAGGKQVEISKFDCKVFNVNSGNRTYKAQISDAAGNVYNSTNTVAVSAEASLTDASFVFGSGKILRGDVTIRIYAWKTSGSPTEFRMGPDVKFYGTVEDYECATPSAPTISGVSEYVPGQTITLTASHDGENYDNLTTYTWYEGDTWGSKSKVQNAATGSAGYTFTKASCAAGDAGKYWCEVSNGTGCDAHNSEGYDVTVYPTYTITYNLNEGACGEVEHKDSYTQFDEDYTLPTPTKTGSVFAGWYGASDFSGLPTVVLGAGSVGNKEYWAKWGETVTVSWTVTKVDDELYRGGGGYSVKAVINETDWSTGFMDELELTATEGVTLKNIEVSENGESKVQVTADFDITTDLAADATSITFTLNVPADGKYGPKVDEHEEDLTSCAGSSTVWNFAYASDDRPTLTNSNASTEGNKNTLSATTGSGNLYYFAGSSDAFETDKYLKMNGASSGGSVNSRSVYQNRCFYIDITSNGTLTIQQYADNGNGAPKYVVANTRPLQSDYPSSSVAPTTTGGATYEINVTNYSSGTADRIWVAYPTAKAYIISVTWTPIGGGGTVTPTLTWDDGDADIANDGVSKSTSNDDFVYTARQNKNSLGAITYSSSDATVATVNATTGQVHLVGAAGTATITATIAASGCFSSANVSYTITVTDDCDDEAGTIETEDLGCSGVKMTVRGHTTTGETVSYQWYKVGTPSDTPVGTNQDNFTATEAGSYYVIVTNTGDRHCAKRSTNTITVEAQAVATETKIVDSWYVKNGRRTPDIELVKTTNATSFTVTSGLSTIWESAGSTKTGFGGCGFHMDENGIIYLNGTKDDGSATTGLTAGDETLTITAIGCGGNASQNITIHKQAATNYKEIAFVADGGKGMRKDSITVGHGVGTELYEYLDSVGTAAENRLFKLSERNIYWTTDEKTIREEYSQFDAILITDDPSTNTVVKKGDDYKTKGYVNAFGTMVDVRPIFTMEAYVSALKNWGSKGIAGNPESPNPRQYEMRLECKDHEIYGAGLPDPEDGTNVWEEVIDGETFRHVILVDSTKGVYKGVAYNAETKGNEKPALQGFTGEAAGSLLGLGRILEGTLQAAIERQEEPAARLLVMGINAKALQPTCALTNEGKTVIKNILVYLLKTNMEEVDDCSNYFTGKNSSDWNNASNWSKNQLPSSEAKVRILAPCVISGIQPHVAQVAIVSSGKSSIRETATGSANCNGSLTINANGALIVEGEVLAADAPHFAHNDLKPTTVNDLIINTNGSGQAALIFDNEEAKTKATVNLYSLGRKDGSYLYQYFAIPMEYLTVSPTFANETHGGTKILTYAYTEAGGWERRGYYADLYAFEGLGITTNTSADHMSYQMKGTLASTATKEINMTNTTRDGFNLIGNSWSAPIQINKLSEDNSSDDIIQTAYVYCTGNDGGTGAVNPTEGAEATGQWIAIPFATSGESTWRESKLSVIPAMQAFQIKVDAAAMLTLDYKKVVRGSTNSLNEKLRAPKRTNAHSDVPMSIIRVKDSKTYTDVCLLEGEIFSDEFDNGWEAEYMAGDGPSATLYAETEIGHMAVAAMPEIEGTVLGFAPGKEREYTFTFLGADMGYYLNDIKLQQSTQINAENSYTFTFEEGDTNRFYISKTPIDAGDTPTEVSNTDATPKAQKFIYQDKLYILRNGVLYDATGKHINSK